MAVIWVALLAMSAHLGFLTRRPSLESKVPGKNLNLNQQTDANFLHPPIGDNVNATFGRGKGLNSANNILGERDPSGPRLLGQTLPNVPLDFLNDNGGTTLSGGNCTHIRYLNTVLTTKKTLNQMF